ncbi:hypothetical protein OPT61_g8695 [Boeremia exigua]|uniref:Uncharacterized protein n=1 Tax=Boeremia exigua TaxID=749465 RepID=A0ACC2HX75_9PLEO|nr:hypothetical protein OPT61_g8695 [Boeremia exigua]
MTVASDSRNRLSYGSPETSRGGGTITEPPPEDIHLDSIHNEPSIAAHPHFTDLTTREQVECAIHRLSNTREIQRSTTGSLSSASSASCAGQWSAPPTPTTPLPSSHQPFTMLEPSPFATSRNAQPNMQSQPRTMAKRKIVRVRPDHRSSHLRREVRYNSQTQVDYTTGFSAQNSATHGILNTSPESHNIFSDPFGNATTHHTRPVVPAHRCPNRAAQACIRPPQRWIRPVRASEEEYRFPSRQVLREEGHPCTSIPCTAPNSLYCTPIDTPFATPPASPMVSARLLPQGVRDTEGVFGDAVSVMDLNGNAVDLRVGRLQPVGSQIPRTEVYSSVPHHTSEISAASILPTSADVPKQVTGGCEQTKQAGDGQTRSLSCSIASEQAKVQSHPRSKRPSSPRRECTTHCAIHFEAKLQRPRSARTTTAAPAPWHPSNSPSQPYTGGHHPADGEDKTDKRAGRHRPGILAAMARRHGRAY